MPMLRVIRSVGRHTLIGISMSSLTIAGAANSPARKNRRFINYSHVSLVLHYSFAFRNSLVS